MTSFCLESEGYLKVIRPKPQNICHVNIRGLRIKKKNENR
jgi:hypothetical protein